MMTAETVIDKLKGLDVDRESLDSLIWLREQAKLLRAGYEDASLDVAEWLTGALDTLNVDIARRSRDTLLLRLKELDQAAAGLQTREEKRAEVAEQRAKLLRRLGKDVPEPVATP